jgi:hypothetical protein
MSRKNQNLSDVDFTIVSELKRRELRRSRKLVRNLKEISVCGKILC